MAIVGEGTAHGVAVAPGDLGFRVRPLCQLPCKGAHAADPLFARLLGVAVGLIDGFGRFTQGGEVAAADAGQLARALAMAQRMEGCPSEMTPTMGTPSACFTSRSRVGQVILGGRQHAAG